MPRFGPASWVQRTNVTGLTSTTQAGHQSRFLDEKVFVTASLQFVGGAPEQVIIGNGAVTRDKGFSWTAFEASPYVIGGESIAAIGSAQRPDGSVNYFKCRFRFGRSFFVGNNTIFSGHIAIDNGFTGTDWFETQKLYTWPHKPDTGTGGQASVTIQAGFVFIPGSGPLGADADWLLIKAHVTSGQGDALNVFQWWRSDDFGQSWTFVRNETTLGSFPNFITQGQTGRIIASAGGVILFSDDAGATWTGSGGAFFGVKTNAFEQAGHTWVGCIPGSGTGPGTWFISCDNGANFQGLSQQMGEINKNCAMIRLSPCEALTFIGSNADGGQQIWYTTNGGEVWTKQGADTRMNGTQAGVVMTALFNDGAPFVVLVDGECFMSSDRATGIPSGRLLCPLAFAGLKRAGIPPNCAHPILTRCD